MLLPIFSIEFLNLKLPAADFTMFYSIMVINSIIYSIGQSAFQTPSYS